jgi:acyl carrier protein
MNKTICHLLETKFNIEASSINKSNHLREIGLDSLEMISLVIELEKIIGREIPDSEMVRLESIQDILDLVK